MKKYKLIRTGILPTNTYVLYDTETKKCVIIDPAYDASKVVSFVEENNFTIESIKRFAASQNVMPYIVIGRLQKEKHLRYDQYSSYKLRYKWAS